MVPGKAVIARQQRLFDDFFKIDELLVTHRQIDGTTSSVQRRLVFERGDSVAVLLFNRDRRAVVLVEQFKAPALVARRRDDPTTTDGWLVETLAGMIDTGEAPEAAAIRETLEETGYRIREPELIGRFFVSPGGTSERVFSISPRLATPIASAWAAASTTRTSKSWRSGSKNSSNSSLAA